MNRILTRLSLVILSSGCSTFPQPPKFSTTPFHDQGRQTRNLVPIRSSACSSEPTPLCHHPCTKYGVSVPISMQSFTSCKANPPRPDSTAQ
ncbi:hypothetical protein BDP81DRAFT_424395 [Colletotrichum phormii]|uniref:Lipoprotein n=1 Tax=Colletotrichum phormii TaxID=359342 RepID=A0AAJ0EIQ7_9PEZI|nr:uncharacterized protein BDP81DRAFT_424395 [Colletotrichum phormii]KAK1638185.1 hypothetical protein BDP81DRAFT_424395 [Colletotrichum phormii]